MRRIHTTILLIFCTLTINAQSQLSFSLAEWDFGAISESGGRVSHTFVGTNNTNKPIVILDIYSSCGCTVPEYSKRPILPGEQREICVTFDPMNRPGSFIKELIIFDSERQKAGKLTIRGNVTPRQKNIEELYPVEAGKGLRLTQSLCTFSYLYHGRSVQSAIGLINTSDSPLRLELRPETSSGMLTIDYPRELAAGAKGEIRVNYTLPRNALNYGTVQDVLIPRINGRDASVRLMAHGMAVDNPELSNKIYHPKVEFDKYILKFGLLKRRMSLQKMPIMISNRGEDTLILRAIEVDGGIGSTLRPGRRIAPGRSITGYVTVAPAAQECGPLSGHLTIVTNDPTKPMQRMRVTAIIED